MVIGIIAIIAAVLLSTVSAVFSISGLTTIFSGAVVAVGIMGGVLEFGKVSATVWLYTFWKKANNFMKAYFLAAILVLILISSIGIYGYLAKSYVTQSAQTQSIETEIEQYQSRIARQEQTIEQAQDQLEMLDQAIERYIELDVITRGLDQREEQQEERQRLRNTITEARDQVATYEDRIFELRQDLNEQSVDVGPVKYLASFLYGEDNAQAYYDNAARILILLLIFVFDPFAVLLMVAGNVAIQKKSRKRKRSRKKKQPQQHTQTTQDQDLQKSESAQQKEPQQSVSTTTKRQARRNPDADQPPAKVERQEQGRPKRLKRE